MKQASYEDIRHEMKVGDVIGFGGKGLVSAVIKAKTDCKVSHVGVVLSSMTADGCSMVMLMESTSLGDGFAGVQVTRMSDHVKNYEGQLWWLPMKEKCRLSFNPGRFQEFMWQQEGKPYDAIQAIGSALDKIMPDNTEDLTKVFCSELVTAGFEVAFGDYEYNYEEGMFTFLGINSSEQTPLDVCCFPVLDAPTQFKGEPAEIIS